MGPEGDRREANARWARDLVAWAEARTVGRGDALPEPPRAIVPPSDDEIRAGVESGRVPTVSRREELEAFARLISAESHALVGFGGIAGYLTQQAWNTARAGPVAVRADTRLESGAVPCALLRAPAWRPPYLPRPAALRVLEGNFYDVAATPDGATALGAEYGGALCLWDLRSGLMLARLPPQSASSNIERVALTPDARWAAAADTNGGLRLWDLRESACRSSFEAHRGAIRSLRLAPDAAWAVTSGADGAIRLWNLRRGTCAAEIAGVEGTTRHVAVSADARLAAIAGPDGTIRVVGLPEGEELVTFAGHEGPIVALAMTPDGRRLVSGGEDGTVRVWEPASCRMVHVLRVSDAEGMDAHVNAVDVTPDGRLAISGGYDTLVRVWDLETGGCLKTFSSHTDTIIAVAIAADGTRAISSTACDDPTIRLWDLAGYDLPRAHGYLGNVWDIALSADGRWAASLDSTIRLWNLESGTSRQLAGNLRSSRVRVEITPDGRYVLYIEGTSLPSGSTRMLHLLNAATGETTCSIDLGPWSENLAISPDGRLALTAGGSSGSPLMLWDLATSARRTIAERLAMSVAFSRDGRLAVAHDGRAWRRDTAELIGDGVDPTAHDRARRLASVVRESFRSAPTTLPGDRLALEVDDQVLRVVDRSTGATLAAVDVLSTIFSAATACGVVAAGDRFGAIHVFHVHDTTPGLPRVTAVRRYRLDLGSWESELTAVCPACRGTVAPTEEILAAVDAWRAALPGNGVPCLDLPDEAFADPRLAAPCPLCEATLRFDPYVVDGRSFDPDGGP